MKQFVENTGRAVLELLPILVAFFVPAFAVSMMLLLVVLVDTHLGMKSARKQGKEINSNRFSDIFAKLIGYGVMLTIGLLINHITGWSYGVWLASIIPLYTEIKSIDENQRALGKKGIIKQAEDVYNFALSIKKKRDELR